MTLCHHCNLEIKHGAVSRFGRNYHPGGPCLTFAVPPAGAIEVAPGILELPVEKPRTSLGASQKADQGKPQWSLVPMGAMADVVAVFTLGARKYAPTGWRTVPNARIRYLDAAFRHLVAVARGEVLDSETGKPHLAHLAADALILLDIDQQEKKNQTP